MVIYLFFYGSILSFLIYCCTYLWPLFLFFTYSIYFLHFFNLRFIAQKKQHKIHKITKNKQKKIQNPPKHTKNIFQIFICTYSSTIFIYRTILFIVFRHKTKVTGFPLLHKQIHWLFSPLSGVAICIIFNNISSLWSVNYLQ